MDVRSEGLQSVDPRLDQGDLRFGVVHPLGSKGRVVQPPGRPAGVAGGAHHAVAVGEQIVQRRAASWPTSTTTAR